MNIRTSIETASEAQLRSWADYRVISSAEYVEEIERRQRAAGDVRTQRIEITEAPPLDYDLDIPLYPEELTLDDEIEEQLPLAARPMFDLVGKLILGALTLIGCGLLAWGLLS